MAFQHLMQIVFVIALLWVIWFFTGGPQRTDNDKPFIKPPYPVDTGIKYGPQ